MKILNWIGAIALLLTGLFFATSKRTAVQRADRLQEQKVVAEQSKKSGSLKKAKKLGDKAKVAMDKAKAAGDRSDARIKKLEERNETSLANRVRDFNNSL
jgi:predicted Zn-dependent protease